MTSRPSQLAPLLIAPLLLAVVTDAHAQATQGWPPIIVVTADLEEVRGGLLELSNDLGVTLMTDDGAVVTFDDALALLTPYHSLIAGPGGETTSQIVFDAGLTALDRGLVTTITGERIPGALVAPELLTGAANGAPQGALEDAIAWAHPQLGTMLISLERIRSLRPGAGSETPIPGAIEDTILLANGDTIAGFIESLGAEVTIDTGAGGGTDLSIDRIALITLVNPPEVAEHPLIWLRDGTAIEAQSFSADRNQPSSALDIETPQGQSARYALDLFRGVLLAPDGLTPLAPLEPSAIGPTSDRPTAQPIRAQLSADDFTLDGAAALGIEDLVMPGPMFVRYALPGDATAFAATATLEPGGSIWSGVTISVLVDGEVVQRGTLNRDQPELRLRAELKGAQDLELRTEATAFGPIKGGVILRRPLLATAR